MLTPDWSDAVFCLRERAGAYNKSFVVYPTGRPKGGSPGMPPSIDWEFVMSVFKIRKKFANFTKFWKFVKIRINSFYNINSNCNVCSNSHNSYSWDYTAWGNRWMGTDGQLKTPILTLPWDRQWSCRWFVDFVICCSWSCWTIDELTNLELHSFIHSYSFNRQVDITQNADKHYTVRLPSVVRSSNAKRFSICWCIAYV